MRNLVYERLWKACYLTTDQLVCQFLKFNNGMVLQGVVTISQKLKIAFAKELNQDKLLFYKGQLYDAFMHFERAHILSQPFHGRHVKSHWWMFRIGINRLDLRETLGQIIRIIGSAGSLIGKYPVGNTGGANVSPFKVMPIPEDLKPYFE